jgi:hypothetical protein
MVEPQTRSLGFTYRRDLLFSFCQVTGKENARV